MGIETINTDLLKKALDESIRLDMEIGEIFARYDGCNLRSLADIARKFHTAVSVNGDIVFDNGKIEAGGNFEWTGSPADINVVRLDKVGVLNDIYIDPAEPQLRGGRFVTDFDIGSESDGDQWGEYTNIAEVSAELGKR